MIRAYKAAILSALAPRQTFNPTQLGMLSKLCNSFHKRPPIPSPVPSWDIGLVLHVLSAAPFEPLEQASLEATTCKAFVLIALTLGARRGELIALVDIAVPLFAQPKIGLLFYFHSQDL